MNSFVLVFISALIDYGVFLIVVWLNQISLIKVRKDAEKFFNLCFTDIMKMSKTKNERENQLETDNIYNPTVSFLFIFYLTN